MSTPNLFGAKPPLFAPTTSAPTPTLGGAPSFGGAPASTAPLFGGVQSTTTPAFGAATTQAAPTFGSGTTQQSVFGGTTTTTPPSTTTATSAPTFGGATMQTTQAPAFTTGAATGTQQVQQPTLQAKTIQEVPQKPLILKSFRYAMSKIQGYLQSFNTQALDDFIQTEANGDLMKNLGQCLLYFKPQDTESRKKLFDPSRPYKWGGKDIVTQRMAEELIVKLSTILNLDELLTFDLLESYFMINVETRQTLIYLITIDNNLSNIEKQMTQQAQIVAQNSQLAGQLFKKLENFKQEFSFSVSKVLIESQSIYLQERVALLSCVLAVVNHASEATVKQMQPKLMASLTRNLESLDTFRSFTCSQRDINASLMREETLILQIMFRIYKKIEVPRPANILEFLKYQLNETRFQGIQVSKPQRFQSDEDLQKMQYKLNGLALQQVFNLFQVQLLTATAPEKNQRLKQFVTNLVKDPETKQLQELLVSIKKHDDQTVLVYLTFRQVVEAIKSLDLCKAFSLPALSVDLGKPDIQHVNFMSYLQELRERDEELFEDAQSKEELQILVQEWVNLTYSYLKENRLEEGIRIAQSMAYSVIQTPSYLEQLWRYIASSRDLLGSPMKSKPIYHTLDIFESVLERPLENFAIFTELLIALCGRKSQKYALNVLGWLSQASGNLLKHYVVLFMREVENLETDSYSKRQIEDLATVIRLFSKMISQNYLLYAELNDEAVKAVRSSEDSMDADALECNEPLLVYLLRSFFAIAQTLELNKAAEIVKCIVKTIKTLYENLPFQRNIWDWLQLNINGNGLSLFVEFFVVNLNESEYTPNSLPLTRQYISFMNALFSNQQPQLFMAPEQQTNLQESVLGQLLSQVYKPLLNNFQKLTFKDYADYLKTYEALLKLTKTLLEYFKDGTPSLKAPLAHRFPQYSEILQIIADCLNSESLEFLIINSLMLGEDIIKGKPSGVTNLLWLDCLKKHAEQNRVLVQKLIKVALNCLNTLMDLSILLTQIETLSAESKLGIGARHQHLRSLKSVVNMANLVRQPGQWDQYQIHTASQGVAKTVHYSLFNIVQYYVKPHLHLCQFLTHIQIAAVRFFFLCVKLWETQPLGQRVSLESTLRTPGMSNQDIRMQYILNLKYATKQVAAPMSLHFMTAFLDLLIVCSSTQSHYVVELLKEPEFIQTFLDSFVKRGIQKALKIAKPDYDRNPALVALSQAVDSKVVIFLSEVSSNKLGEGLFRRLAEQDDYLRIYENVIKQMVEETLKPPIIRYDGEISLFTHEQESVSQGNDIRALNLYGLCQAYITLRYYLKLLGDEHQKDVGSKSVKKAIVTLYENPKVLQSLAITHNLQEHFQNIDSINEHMKGYENRNSAYIKDFWLAVETRQKRTDEQIKMNNNPNNKLVTGDECPVYLASLDCQGLTAQTAPYSYLQGDTALSFSQQSRIGTQFIINTDELTTTAQTYFYKDESLLAGLLSLGAQFNMAASLLYSYQQYILGHKEFLLSVGKATMRQNQRNRALVLENRAFSTSLANLVVPDEITEIVKNQNQVQVVQTKLGKLLIDLARPFARKISGSEVARAFNPQRDVIMSDSKHSNALELAQNEIDIDFLCILLGSLNSVSDLHDLSSDVLKVLDMEILQNLVKGLPRIKLSHFQSKGHLFISLVLQIFSLSHQVKERVGSLPQNEVDFIQVISYVLKAMQEGGPNFTAGLKILELSFGLISQQKLQQFMRKQEGSPLRIVIQRYLNPSSSIEEKIKVIEFLTSYAREDQGAEHLNQENILKNISINQLMTLMNSVDFYMVEQEQKRNPIHILWCHVLVLIRTLNMYLFQESPENRRQMSSQISLLWQRMSALLDFGFHLQEGKFDSKALSLALFEELELITGIIQQYFDYADELYELDPLHYAEIKDKLLFGALYLFTQDRASIFSSSTEQFLLSTTHDKIPSGLLKVGGPFSGLDLALEIQKIKTFFNVMSSLLNAAMLSTNKSTNDDYINTWVSGQGEYTSRKSRGGASYSQVTGALGSLSVIDNQNAIINMVTCVSSLIAGAQRMSENFKQWLGADPHLNQLFDTIQGLFKNDEWINNEYLGLNAYFSGLSYTEVLQMYEESLHMSFLTATLMLGKLRSMAEKAQEIGLALPSTISTSKLNDSGNAIVEAYKKLDQELKKPGVKVKLSVDNTYGEKISEYLKELQKADNKGGYASKMNRLR